MDSQNNASTKLDVYQLVTDRIISLLEQGTVPWQQPWTSAGMPMNLLSKRPYRGINLWLLLSLNYERNLFLTWDQVKKHGGSVKQGEHGHIVIYWKPSKKDDEDENQKNPALLRYYKVFNITQCRDLPASLLPVISENELEPLAECERVVSQMPERPAIHMKGQQAFYDIEKDSITMPKQKSFKTMEGYYGTLFHELVHSTGHEKRLNRASITEMAEFGSELYSIEELIAELGSAYLSGYCGIIEKQIKSSAAYIEGWLGKLKNDKKFIVKASGMAQKAVDYILKVSEPAESEEQTELVAEQ